MGNQDKTGLDRWQVKKLMKDHNIHLKDLILPYAAIQFYPIVALIYMLCFWPSDASLSRGYLLPTLALYLIAKIFEKADEHSEYFFDVIMRKKLSGHTLKHIAAGVAVLSLVVYITNVQ
eukprot:CAMPEP_0113945514 /NCGR_PEP_ID=MMETSP1339-20121228/47244_1 /TAXON_ID=94617 /ORGANISM="Fibrocapsa japonica" /LENGTH=118 /DNA_ID=CAMNT_0000951135 /DNA_START=705 /DNA_END=1061 /DNA_ORIENTATION=+ /assembly_acc=CAM_ASM_000762